MKYSGSWQPIGHKHRKCWVFDNIQDNPFYLSTQSAIIKGQNPGFNPESWCKGIEKEKDK